MQHKAILILIFCLLYSYIFSQTQTPVYFSQSIPNANSKGLYQYLPAGYTTSGKNYPLIIWLHGAGQVGQGNSTDLPKVLLYGLPNVISKGNFPSSFTAGDSSFSFIVISPQFISNPIGSNVAAILTHVINNYRVDPERIYMLGMSAGGAGVCDYASMSTANSNKLAAIIPFAGNLNPSQAQANRIASANLPVWAFHNTNDGTVPVTYSRNWKNYINSYIPTPSPLLKLTEFPVVSGNAVIAHDCWTNTTVPTYKENGINIYEWLLKYKKRIVTTNAAPLAFAGNDASVILPANLSLSGILSYDPDGSIVSFRWRKISGPASYNFSDSTIANPTVQNLSVGIYSFELTVTDNLNATSKDTVMANVSSAVDESTESRVLIDVGPPPNIGALTVSPTNGYYWNNMTDARPGLRISNAKTTTNANSTISLSVINRIDGTSNTASNGMNGANTTPAVGIYPVNATKDFAYSHISATNGRWRISGLNPVKLYVIKFWGTKSGETANRDIEIKRSDEPVWKSYGAAGNTNFNNGAFFNVTGKTEVDFDIRTKSPSIYGYINVVDISWNVGSSNQPPVARAGNNISITLPLDSVVLNGCTSSDPENAPLKYKWRKIAGPANFVIVNDTLCTTKIKNLVAGNYNFELMVTDTGGISHKDTVSLTVAANNSLAWPVLPAAICSQSYKIVILGSSTAFGTGALPLDSSWSNKLKIYVQQQNAQVTVTNLSLGGYTTYHVNPTGFVPETNKPFPDPARNITAALALNPNAIIINLPTNDAASAFTIQETQDNFNRIVAAADAQNVPVWVTTSQPRDGLSVNQVNSLFQLRDWVNQRFGNKAIDFWTDIANADGTVSTTYGAGDGVHLNNLGHHVVFSRVLREKIWDSICIRRNISTNLPPIANAGSDLFVTTTPLTLNGSSSYDPEGEALTFSWRVINNPLGSLTNVATSQPVFSATSSGIYNIELTVTDNYLLNDKDTVSVYLSVPNILPVANAGIDLIIQSPADSALLNGAASYDIDGIILKYKWQKILGPAAFILNDSIANPWVKGLSAGNYLFELLVTDTSLAVDKDTVAILVNTQPVANAGADNTITLPTNTTSVSGAASSDANGSITNYNWRKITGPAGSFISNGGISQTNISFTTAGEYQFELMVTDNNGGVGKDTILITVYPNPNIAPVANAGIDKIIQLPVSRVLLDGRLSNDTNGSISSYLWSYISGPAGSQLLTSTRDTCSATFTNSGTYIFRLTVTDNGGLTASDDVQVIVQQGPVTSRSIKVNIANGSIIYNNAQWNNWAPVANVNSAAFKYEDGSLTTIFANLLQGGSISDNGATYLPTATVCPPPVLRINSMHTITRTLTLSGLSPLKQYSFEFYGSRGFTSGSKSIFRTGTVADTINTDFNVNDIAKLNNIRPDVNGRVVFTLSLAGSYHYMAGFTIIEPNTAQATSRIETTNDNISSLSEVFMYNDGDLSIYPNPFMDRVSIRIKNQKPGPLNFKLTDMAGKIIWQKNSFKINGTANEVILTNELKKGIYILQIFTNDKRSVHKLIRQ